MLKAIIFDMDGVIVDSEPFHVKAEMKVMASYGVEISEEELLVYLGTTAKLMFEDLIEKYDLSVEWETLNEEKEKMFIPMLRDEAPQIKGLFQLLEYCKEKGLKLAIASSSKRNLVDIVIEKFGLDSFFSVSVSGDEVENGKPDPEIFLSAAEKLGVDPGECMVIEDAATGVKAAKSAGMKCIAYNCLYNDGLDFELADDVVSGLGEVIERGVIDGYQS